MGHAAGQLADGLHLLRLPQLFLDALLFGDVDDRAFLHDPAVAFAQGDVFQQPDRFAVARRIGLS